MSFARFIFAVIGAPFWLYLQRSRPLNHSIELIKTRKFGIAETYDAKGITCHKHVQDYVIDLKYISIQTVYRLTHLF